MTRRWAIAALALIPYAAPSQSLLKNSFLSAASSQGRGLLSGRVSARSTDLLSSLSIEIIPTQHGQQPVEAALAADGTFAIQGLPSGSYQLRVVSLMQREAVYTTLVQVAGGTAEVAIDLNSTATTRPASGYISMRDWTNPPPRKARQAFSNAERFEAKADFANAATEYQRAIEIHPDFAAAHLRLGLVQLQLNRWREADLEFGAALRLGLDTPQLRTGQSVAYSRLGRAQEAEQSARAALAKDPSDALAHYLLANLLLSRGGAEPEVLDHLAKSLDRYPTAYVLRARVLAQLGDVQAARRDIAAYAEVCPPAQRAAAESWLARLQSAR